MLLPRLPPSALGAGPVDTISGRKVSLEGDVLKLAPYARLWLSAPG